MRSLDITKRSIEAQSVLDTLSKRVVGQKDATQILVDIVENFQAGFAPKGRPAGNALFLGPTGSGKTHVVESLCQGLFGDKRSCIKIDCAEYQHGHEIAKLVGSPPGYLGHRETHPMLTQEALDQWHTPKLKLSVVLFDEIEKASDTLWNLMLGILDKGSLTLGDNRKVDFSNVIILMTSNLGANQMDKETDGKLGFSAPEQTFEQLDEKLEEVAKHAAKSKFSPEFYNRIDNVAVFKTLNQEQIGKVLDIELGALHTRLLFESNVKFFWHVTKRAKEVLIRDGFSKKYGARHLSRAVRKRVITPLARLVASGQLIERDVVVIDEVGKSEFDFSIDEGVL